MFQHTTESVSTSHGHTARGNLATSTFQDGLSYLLEQWCFKCLSYIGKNADVGLGVRVLLQVPP